MQERTEMCGGSFSLYSRPGAGASIRASFPLNGDGMLKDQATELNAEKTDMQTEIQSTA
jgi:hypothetical protein